jgi:hypothetical protein
MYILVSSVENVYLFNGNLLDILTPLNSSPKMLPIIYFIARMPNNAVCPQFVCMPRFDAISSAKPLLQE